MLYILPQFIHFLFLIKKGGFTKAQLANPGFLYLYLKLWDLPRGWVQAADLNSLSSFHCNLVFALNSASALDLELFTSSVEVTADDLESLMGKGTGASVCWGLTPCLITVFITVSFPSFYRRKKRLALHNKRPKTNWKLDL